MGISKQSWKVCFKPKNSGESRRKRNSSSRRYTQLLVIHEMGRVITATTMGARQQQQPVARPNMRQGSRESQDIHSPPVTQFPHAQNIREFGGNNPAGLSPPYRTQQQPKKPSYTPQMSSKKYCCSSTAQKECKLWAIFDIITASFVWILLTYFAIVLKTDQPLLEAIVASDRENERDLNRFLHHSSIKQDLTIVVAIIREMTSVILGALLLLAAQKKAHQQVQMWLVATFIAVIVDLVLFIPKMAFTQNKFLYASMMVAYFLYKWYEVYVASILYKEIRQELGSQIDELEGENNPGYERDPMDNYGKPQDIAGLNQFQQPPNINTIGHNLRTYGRVGNVNTTGWETDTVCSNDTFVLSQPSKRRNNAQTRDKDTGPVEGGNYGGMDPDYQPPYRY